MKNKINLALMIALTSLSSTVFAGSESINIQANAQLTPSCILSTQNVKLDFTPEATARVLRIAFITKMTCSKGLVYNIALDAGSSGDTSARTMKSANGDVIKYRIYGTVPISYPFNTNPSNSTSFTNQELVGQGYSVNMLLFSNLLVNQFVSPGDYSDTLSFTVTY